MKKQTKDSKPDISIIIPIYNEEGILLSAVHDLLMRLPALDRSFELILAENGSADRTAIIAQELSSKYPGVKTFSVGEANYGLALRQGIERAMGTYVMCDEVDICDVNFYWRALEILERMEDYVGICAVFRDLGVAYTKKRNWGEADSNFRKAEHVLSEINSPFNNGHLYLEWGRMYKAMGEKEKAEAYLSKSADIFEEIKAKVFLAMARKELGGLQRLDD